MVVGQPKIPRNLHMKLTRLIEKIARSLAILGGFILLAITLLTCLSILGRSMAGLGLGPIKGDFELVEVGVAFAVFAFLPWCQFSRGHATVDIFTNFLPAGVNRWINLIAETLMAAALLVITWKLYDGMISTIRYGDTTFILEMPVWIPYAACLFTLAIACLVATYLVFVRLGEVIAKNPDTDFNSGAVH